MSSSSAMAMPGRSLRSKRTMPAPSVLIMEKMPDPGGISITSGGNVRIVDDAEEGFRHLQATNAGTTPDSVLRALAAGMQEIPAYFDKLATRVRGHHRSAAGGRQLSLSRAPRRSDTSASIMCPASTPSATYPFVSSYVPIHRAAGVRLFKVIEDNIRSRRHPRHAVDRRALD